MSNQDEWELDLMIEGYCMSCRETVVMEEPQAVWTRKGQPATRGTCPMCGGMVFRMGKNELHDELKRPEPIKIGDSSDKRNAPKLERDTVYVNYALVDEEVAQRVADDLEKSGITVWMHDHADSDVNWSSGVHPALKVCKKMVFVLSTSALNDSSVQSAWEFFREKRKPIVIAQFEATPPPDAIRRSPRYDFVQDYKASLRQMIHDLHI